MATRTLIMIVLLASAPQANADQPLAHKSEVHFCAIDEAKDLIAERDTFLKALSPFDRKVRLQTEDDATEAALVEFIQREVLPWTDELQSKVMESIQRIRPKLEPYRLPLPAVTRLILMTGKEEANAAYTRGTAIFLPRDRVQKLNPDGLDRLMLHELFHVLSRHSPEVRRDLYRIIGFEVCEPIALPPKLAELKLTNPDAPLIDCRMNLMEEGKLVVIAPILYSSSEKYDSVNKPSLFKYLTFRLLRIEESDGRWQPVVVDGQPVLIDPAKASSFQDQIGQNTKYIIHPDEILADNFVHMIVQTEKLPSPEIVARMSERLRQPPP